MLIIFGALKIEIAAVLNLMSIDNISKTDGTTIYKGKINNEATLAVTTGMGKANAKKAVELIIEKYITGKKSPADIESVNKTDIKFIITGFCGATDKNLDVGDLVIYESIKNLESTNRSDYVCKDILELKNDGITNFWNKFKLTRVLCGTVPGVFILPLQKKIIGKQFGVHVIDLESYWIIKIIIECNLPFYCIRSVSDTIEDKLPEYSGIFSKNEILSKLLKSFLLSIIRPKELKTNIKAIKNIKKAQNSLKHALESLIFYLINKA